MGRNHINMATLSEVLRIRALYMLAAQHRHQQQQQASGTLSNSSKDYNVSLIFYRHMSRYGG
jgi:hypothetical protein